MRATLSCTVLIAISYLACVTDATGAPNHDAALGINLGGVTYWSSEIVFVDLFKHSQTFKSQAPGKSYAQGGPLDLTENGWVRIEDIPSGIAGYQVFAFVFNNEQSATASLNWVAILESYMEP